MQIVAFSMLAYIRIKSDLQLFKNIWFVSYSIVTLVAIHAGFAILCFRQKKCVCLFLMTELASLMLFAVQIYMFIDDQTSFEELSDD